jgi:hypothetical protein
MLKQEGNVVTGQIDDLRATINGKIEGYSFQGSWKTAQASGSLSLQLAPDLRTFRGTMTPQNTIRSYEWRGTRLADSSAPTTTGTRPRRSRGLGIPPPN